MVQHLVCVLLLLRVEVELQNGLKVLVRDFVSATLSRRGVGSVHKRRHCGEKRGAEGADSVWVHRKRRRLCSLACDSVDLPRE